MSTCSVSFFHCFLLSLIHRPLTHSFTYSFIHSFIYSITKLFSYSIIHCLTHKLFPSPTHLPSQLFFFIYPFIHSSIHSFILQMIYSPIFYLHYDTVISNSFLKSLIILNSTKQIPTNLQTFRLIQILL